MKKNKNVEKQKCGKNDKESTLHISAAVVTDIMQHIHPPKEQKDKYAKKKIVERLNLKSNERWLIVDSQIFSANEYKKNVLLSGFQVFLPKCENNLFCIICNGTVSKKLQQLFEHLHLSNHANTFENINVIKLLRNIKTTTNNLLEMANSTLKSKKQEKIVKSLKKVLLPYIPHMKIYPFGSRKNGLGLPDSDIDIFIDCGVDNNEVNQKQVQEKEQYLQMIYNILYHQTQDWKCLQIILNARIPIIKLLHLSTSLHCDISVKSALSVENTKLISSYNTAYPPCRKLILFLKKWWSLCNISYGQPITSYGLSCLVIFYLQLKVGLPSVATLIKEHGKSKKTGVWETGVAYPNCDKVLSVDFNDLLRGFFDYYANFDYINLVVCPLMGYAVRKKHFTQPQQLPKEMAPYKLSLTKSNPYHFRIDSLMCIQDPFDLAKNITAGVRNIVLLHFKEYCSKSALLLNISEP
ncbi:hypothetical protein KM043_014027 [Ampulex compressa]|nr:hypothetical protein KM043_014027 [Ampulex compressa]